VTGVIRQEDDTDAGFKVGIVGTRGTRPGGNLEDEAEEEEKS